MTYVALIKLLYLEMYTVSNPQCWFSSVFLVPQVSETLSVLCVSKEHILKLTFNFCLEFIC